jgi:hypothetical protein
MNQEFSKYKYRLDLVFSYWIFFWFLLYKTGINIWNPKLALLLGLFSNFIKLIWMILINHSSFFDVILFIIINIFIKIIPVYLLRKTSINFFKDTYQTLIIFLIYILWIILNGVNLHNYKDVFKLVPITNYIHDLLYK